LRGVQAGLATKIRHAPPAIDLHCTSPLFAPEYAWPFITGSLSLGMFGPASVSELLPDENPYEAS